MKINTSKEAKKRIKYHGDDKKKKRKTALIVVGSIVLLGGVTCAIALPLTLCKQKPDIQGNDIDGSNWSGRKSGTLSYEIHDNLVSYVQTQSEKAPYVATDLVIPEKVVDTEGNEYVVNAIEENAFYDENLSGSLTLPKSIVSIGIGAFYGINELTSVQIADSTSTEELIVKGDAFRNCGKLSKVDFSNASNKFTIGDGCFAGCPKLTEVALNNFKNDSVATPCIGSGAFKDDLVLTKFSALGSYNNNISIGSGAFWGCTMLSNLEFPHISIDSIGAMAFADCASLTVSNIKSLQLGSNLSSFSDTKGIAIYKSSDTRAYDSGCLYVGNINSFSDELPLELANSIGDDAFHYCASLTDITFSSDEIVDSSIGEGAFAGCINLKNITFANIETPIFTESSTTSKAIGSNAFADCTSLKNIVFPNVTSWTPEAQSADTDAFDNCAKSGYIVFSNVGYTPSDTVATDGAKWMENYAGGGWTGSATPKS